MITIPNLNTAQYHLGDIGKIIYCPLNCEITKPYDFFIVIRKPSGAIIEVSGIGVVVDGLPYLKYVCGDILDEVGCWKCQSKVVAGRNINFGCLTTFRVKRNL
jgi:hypothetical protein